MMAEPEKQPQVEVDTDDVQEKEQTVQVKEPEVPKKEKEKPNLNVGEIDLGYTDHEAKKDEKAEVVVEEEPLKDKSTKQAKVVDDLTQISGNVQKRIDKLTHRYREAERRERAALDFAKGLQKKYDHSMDQFKTADQQYLKEFDARVDSQREQVKNQLKEAITTQDADKIMAANDKLTQLAVEKEKARFKIAEQEQRTKQEEEDKKLHAAKDQIPDQLPQPSTKARDWAGKNEWFGKDKVMTNAAWSIHDDIAGRGIEVDSEEYYTEINRQMKSYFPDRFDTVSTEEKTEPRKPVQTVASAGRKQQGRRTVRLTKSQVAIAKKLGVPLEEYAKYVKEES
jgi:hypothetical protein